MNQSETNKTMSIGDIFWITLEDHIRHPYVVISQPTPDTKDISVTLITTNQNKANMPGNVVLDENEGNLTKPSIIDAASTIKVQESDLQEFIGKLSDKRVEEIKSGISFLERTYFGNRETN